MMEENLIKVGDYVIVQRQNYTKLHKIKEHGNLSLGQFLVEMDNVVGAKYFDTFQMKNVFGSKKMYTLEKVEEMTSASNLNIKSSGKDNRNIVADEQSQKLTKTEIEELIDKQLSSNNIVENLINNSTTFNSKTEYSQEKYIKKKEKKYFEYIQIRRPTIRLLSQMYYRQDPIKVMGMRLDDLSQILVYGNIQSDGNYVLFDSGTQGLVPAAILNAIGAKTTGKLIYIHPGNECQKNALVAMQFPQEQLERCINVNLYSVLRCYYQHDGCYTKITAESESKAKSKAEESSIRTEEIDNSNPANNDDTSNEPSKKRIKLDADLESKRPGWQLENEKACAILKNKVDGVIIVAKEHPVNLAKELISFLKGGRYIVVFSSMKEPLQDLYVYLKSRLDCIYITLSSNFMRNYQVLPDRTHPEVMMSNGGYILSVYKLNS